MGTQVVIGWFADQSYAGYGSLIMDLGWWADNNNVFLPDDFWFSSDT